VRRRWWRYNCCVNVLLERMPMMWVLLLEAFNSDLFSLLELVRLSAKRDWKE
jgi:hypothetical protein